MWYHVVCFGARPKFYTSPSAGGNSVLAPKYVIMASAPAGFRQQGLFYHVSPGEIAMSKILEINDGNFDAEVLGASIPVLVDFWAPWCGPCKAVTPILEALNTEQTDFRVTKVNVDDCPELAQKYGVRAIPTILLFKDGAEVGRKIGASGKPELVQFVQDSVRAGASEDEK